MDGCRGHCANSEDGQSDQCRKEGFNDLYRSGLIKVMHGVTSLEEVSRVTSGH